MSRTLSSARAPLVSRLTLVATLSALALTACGGSAKNGDAESPPAPEGALEDKGNRVPGVFEFPEGGTDFRGTVPVRSLPSAIDQTGTFWFMGCGGVIAIHEGEARLYDPANSGIPENVTYMAIDASNRKWLSGSVPGQSTLGVLEHGEFRTVLTSAKPTVTRASANGVVWTLEINQPLDEITLRQFWPAPEATVAVPIASDTLAYNVITDHDGALWLTVGLNPPRSKLYRWSEGSWSGPFSRDAEGLLQYETQQDTLWSFVDDDSLDVRRVSWSDGGLEERAVQRPAIAGAGFAGFARDGRDIWVANDELIWMKDGVVSETQTLPDEDGAPTIGWNDSLYFYTESTVYRKEGAEFRLVLDLSDFRGDCP